MFNIKNKIINVFTVILSSVMRQEKMQEALSETMNNYLNRDDAQGQLDKFLDRYLLREMSKGVITQSLANNEEIKKLLWKINNIRPTGDGMHWASLPNSIREQRMIQATIEAGQFIQQHIPHLEGMPDAYATLDFALNEVTQEGLHLEFGVFSGATIRHIADQVGNKQIVHGFDSFEGLPEAWGALKKNHFDTKGNLPEVPDNVILHKGWFEDTIDPFLQQNQGNIAFLHADADLYSSTKTILTKLSDRIVKGTIIVFDEMINYPYWKENEYQAFMEFIEAGNRKFEYIAYTDRGYSVAIKII